MRTPEDAIDFETQQGAKLKASLENRLYVLRLQNDNDALGERETAVLRGRIAEVKSMLTRTPKFVSPMPSYGSNYVPGRE